MWNYFRSLAVISRKNETGRHKLIDDLIVARGTEEIKDAKAQKSDWASIAKKLKVWYFNWWESLENASVAIDTQIALIRR